MEGDRCTRRRLFNVDTVEAHTFYDAPRSRPTTADESPTVNNDTTARFEPITIDTGNCWHTDSMLPPTAASQRFATTLPLSDEQRDDWFERVDDAALTMRQWRLLDEFIDDCNQTLEMYGYDMSSIDRNLFACMFNVRGFAALFNDICVRVEEMCNVGATNERPLYERPQWRQRRRTRRHWQVLDDFVRRCHRAFIAHGNNLMATFNEHLNGAEHFEATFAGIAACIRHLND